MRLSERTLAAPGAVGSEWRKKQSEQTNEQAVAEGQRVVTASMELLVMEWGQYGHVSSHSRAAGEPRRDSVPPTRVLELSLKAEYQQDQTGQGQVRNLNGETSRWEKDRTKGMPQQLKALATLAEEPSWVPSTHICDGSKLSVIPAPGDLSPSGFCGHPAYMWCT